MSGDTRDLDNREYAKRMRAKRGLPPEPEPLAKEGDKLEVEDPKSLAAILGDVRKKTTREGGVAPRPVEKPKPCPSTDRFGKRCAKPEGHSGACVYTIIEVKKEKRTAREALIARRRSVGLARLGKHECPIDGVKLRVREAGIDPAGGASYTSECANRAWHCDACGFDFDHDKPFGDVLEAIVKVDRLKWSDDLKRQE